MECPVLGFSAIAILLLSSAFYVVHLLTSCVLAMRMGKSLQRISLQGSGI